MRCAAKHCVWQLWGAPYWLTSAGWLCQTCAKAYAFRMALCHGLIAPGWSKVLQGRGT